MNAIFRLCKKVSDPPDEIKSKFDEWKSVPCCICGIALRATVKATNAAGKLGADLNPICFDCAKRGPEYVLENLCRRDKVRVERETNECKQQ